GLMAKIKEASKLSRPLVAQVAALAERNQNDEAAALLYGELGAHITDWRKASADLEAYETKLSQGLAAEAHATYQSARQIMLILGGIALLASIAVALLVTLSITRPIARAVSAANELAEGNLAIVIDADGRDETAQLLAA